MNKRILATLVALVILLSTASAFAIVQAPYISVTKNVSPDFFNEGDDAAITISISGEGEPAVIHNPVDVMIVIDRSGSMNDDGWNPPQPITDTMEAAKMFVDQLDPSSDRSGLVTFNDHATLDQNLTFTQQDVKDAISVITVGGRTAIGNGINTALTELASNGRDDAYLFQVVLSDGMNNDGINPLTAAEGAAANGVIIFTIGLGSGADETNLQNIADVTGGDYYYAPSSSDLEGIYQEIAEEIRDIAGSNVILTDMLPDGVELSGSLPDGCSSEENPDGTTTITCAIPGNVNIGDSFLYSFDIIVNDPDLTEVNLEGSGITYNNYNGDPAEILFDNPPVIVCSLESTPLECSSEGIREWSHDWNHPECGDDYYSYEEDQSCSCIYTPWVDKECSSDGYMLQTRTEESGLPFCDGGLEREVQDSQCDCYDEEAYRECVSDGSATVYYEWNFEYCDDDYSETEEDQSCLCIYTDWLDVSCIADSLMSQVRDELSGLPFCTEPLYQEVGNPQCDCDTMDIPLECSSEGTREWLHEWNYPYCGDYYYTDEQDASCDCLATEFDRLCVDDGTAEVFYEWNYSYCGSDYSDDEYDQSCASDYVCGDWYDIECVADGMMEQERYCEDQYGNDYYEQQEVQDASCGCYASDYGSECVYDGYAKVYYEWNFGYCGADYSQEEQDPYCSCDYSDWYDDDCVDDGIMLQFRDEFSGHYYCDGELERMAENAECSCESEEMFRECIYDGYALAHYEWNHYYCGDEIEGDIQFPGYVNEEQDENCSCVYTDWIDEGCIDDGIMSQVRTEESDYEYCGEPLYQEVENGECSCVADEVGRICSGLGTANVSYEWNHDYCGENHTQEEDDELCGCSEGEVRNCGSSVGRCEYGTQTCESGVWSECSGGIGPTGEICNGIDDNCDGGIDEGVCGGGGGSTIKEDWCGNLWCGDNETCENCSRDCGVCETHSQDTGEGEICNPLWECDEWSECADGKQSRTCRDRWECEDPSEYEEERDCDGGTDGITGLVTGQEAPFQWWIALLAAMLSGLVYWQRGKISSGTGRILGAK